MTNTLSAEFRPLAVPASADAADGEEFREMIRVRNAVYEEISGNDDESVTPKELLPNYKPNPENEKLTWLVRVDGEIVGRVAVDFPQEKGSRVAFWLVELFERVHGHGIGSDGYALVEQAARERGRSVLQTWATHKPAEGTPYLDAPTGFGRVPRDHAARFLEWHGFVLEQIERKSSLDLRASVDAVDALHREAVAASSGNPGSKDTGYDTRESGYDTRESGYETVTWELPTPDEWVADYAWMKSRMSTDAPQAEMEWDEEEWDAERVRRMEERLRDGGYRVQVTAARHIDSGRLVAFNELAIGEDVDRPTEQFDTLVLKEHRGHKLGLLVKTAGVRSWRQKVPTSPRVITYNAEENRPMLDVNEAMGFVPDEYNGAWKKTLT